jgi:hypothetical protein
VTAADAMTRPAARPPARPLARLLATFLAAAAYGFALGASHDLLGASRNLVKFPLLIVATATIASLAFWVAALALRADLSFAAVQRTTFLLFHDVAILLASLAPAVLFVGLVLRATDDGWMGEYDLFLAANVGLIAASGSLALVRRAQALLPASGLTLRRALRVVVAWLALALFVGGQVAFLMRPLIGVPATRGATPPWFLGSEPDARGATSFYGAIFQAMTHRRLATVPSWALPSGAGSGR